MLTLLYDGAVFYVLNRDYEMKALIKGLFVVWLLALGSAVAAEQKAEQGKAVSPLMWKLEYQGRTSWAFGSIHFGEKAMFPLPDKVNQAFDQSDGLVLELRLDSEAQAEIVQMVQKHGVDAKKPLFKWLSEAEQQKFNQYCKDQGMVCAPLKLFKPWLASITLVTQVLFKSGFDANYGIDKHFEKLAKAQQKTIQALESPKEQMDIFANQSDDIQVQMLMEIVEDEGPDLSEMIDYWYQGNGEELVKMFALKPDADEGMKAYHYQLYNQRNKNMATRLMDLLALKKRWFVVVGTAHYLGDENVLMLLEEKGVKVTPVKY